ncbi:outer membrane lipid asymmetry maintenance protein MlaD [Parachitinimonas caeni]|uniref:Outer membrane lipid asymmetry maintenance protein MlaD n=1 Tax=Parachitinimonas caeni TaxID=3031301 RepID=A0ABT7DTM8_9NEIS|nr:outer membrane lipid asymmetry maintenance protein MlaD [Parachitinimonas caeni]MDK2123159.1 outer membrane lipid asymmetry maintenance protein MlaD [Parachitinimonas caeni]
MNRKFYDFWVGLFAVLGFAALAFLALRVANMQTVRQHETYKISAEFDNIGGLKVRAPIKSAGVVVGRVSGIALDPKRYRAVVSMELDRQYLFSRDASAEILTSGILGEQYIGVSPGAEETMLKDGDRIKLTSSAIVLEQLISQMLFNKAADGSSGGNKQ